jgi:hypothetical protein
MPRLVEMQDQVVSRLATSDVLLFHLLYATHLRLGWHTPPMPWPG